MDSIKFLEGRSIDDLNTDEIYVLAKVLPDFRQEQRLQTYKIILRDTIDEGYVSPTDSLQSFKDIRQELDISDQEHDTILTELGQQYPELFDPHMLRNRENTLRLESYRETLLEIILLAQKTNPDEILVPELMKVFSRKTSLEVLEHLLKSLSPEARNLVKELRQQYSITANDEADALKKTDPYQLWKAIAERIGLLEYLSAGREEELRTFFEQIDTDASGYISLHELKIYIRTIDPHITDFQIERMLEAADTSGDYLISYDEFQAVFKSLKS